MRDQNQPPPLSSTLIAGHQLRANFQAAKMFKVETMFVGPTQSVIMTPNATQILRLFQSVRHISLEIYQLDDDKIQPISMRILATAGDWTVFHGI